jgi:hypothetical protein
MFQRRNGRIGLVVPRIFHRRSTFVGKCFGTACPSTAALSRLRDRPTRSKGWPECVRVPVAFDDAVGRQYPLDEVCNDAGPEALMGGRRFIRRLRAVWNAAMI